MKTYLKLINQKSLTGFSLLIFLFSSSIVFSQQLKIVDFSVDGEGEVYAIHKCEPLPKNCDPITHDDIPWQLSGTICGVDYDYVAGRSYSLHCTSDCGTVRSNISSNLYIKGDGSSHLKMDWQNWAHVYSLVETDMYDAHAKNYFEYNYGILIQTGGNYSDGDQLEIYYQYEVFGAGWTKHDSISEDTMYTSNLLSINEVNILNQTMNYNDPGLLGHGAKRIVYSGVLTVNVGDIIQIDFESNHYASIELLGEIQMGKFYDKATCNLKGHMEFSFDPFPIQPISVCP